MLYVLHVPTYRLLRKKFCYHKVRRFTPWVLYSPHTNIPGPLPWELEITRSLRGPFDQPGSVRLSHPTSILDSRM